MNSTKECRKCLTILDISQFSKHSGTKDKLDNRCKECVKKVKQKARNEDYEQKIYKIQEFDFNIFDWQIGKYAGTILKRESECGSLRYDARITINKKLVSKSFPFNTDENDAHSRATVWLQSMSNNYNLTKNRMRYNKDNYVDVDIGNNRIIQIDIDDINICQQYMICASKSGTNKNAEYYACISKNGKNKLLHNFLTGNTMTDHIDRQPLNNRRSNLRQITSKENNNNRGPNKKPNKTSIDQIGVRLDPCRESWQARIKQDGKEYSKSFAIKKYGYDEAKRLAIEARKEFNIKFNCYNSVRYDGSDGNTLKELQNKKNIDMIDNAQYYLTIMISKQKRAIKQLRNLSIN